MTCVHEVVVPQLGVNDERVRIVAWKAAPGTPVQRGAVLAELETTKASFELEAEHEGYFYPLAEEGSEAPIRAAVALISTEQDAGVVSRYRQEKGKAETAGGPQLTTKARILAEKFGLDISTLPTGRILREEDIREMAGEAPPPKVVVPGHGDAVVYGASQGGMVVAEALRSMGCYRPVAYLDDNTDLEGVEYEGLPVWMGSTLETLAAKGVAGIATHIAKAQVRLSLRDRCAHAGLAMLNVVHARAYVAPTARMGVGNLIKSGAIVDDYVELGDCCIIDNGVVLPHHNRIGSGVHLAPGVCMGGDCSVGDETIVGVGAVLAPRLVIGSRVIIGAGAVVTRDVPDGAIVEGTPAKIAGSRMG